MHEESVIRSLLKQVSRVAGEHGATVVDEVEIEIGPLSGFEPLLLESAFERLRLETPCAPAELKIAFVPLTVFCETCEQESELASLQFSCPRCGSPALQIVRGDSVRLLNVRLQIPETPSQTMAPPEILHSNPRSA